MVFNFNPLMKIKEKRDNTTCRCAYSSIRNTFFEKLEHPGNNGTESLCSFQATRRGAGQRVISFSMFGENVTGYYLKGLLKNINAIKKNYPHQYIVRLYYNEQNLVHKEILCDIFCTELNVDLCNVNDIGKLSLDISRRT